MSTPPNSFMERADAHINLANSHVTAGEPVGATCGSFVHAAARFNAWMIATSCRSQEELQSQRDEKLAFFTQEYSKMLAQNLDDYIAHFEGLMTPQDK